MEVSFEKLDVSLNLEVDDEQEPVPSSMPRDDQPCGSRDTNNNEHNSQSVKLVHTCRHKKAVHAKRKFTCDTCKNNTQICTTLKITSKPSTRRCNTYVKSAQNRLKAKRP